MIYFIYFAVACLAIALAFQIYFYPSDVATKKLHHQSGAIFALNLLFGWTLLGWGIALIWALTEGRLSTIVDDNQKLKFLSDRPTFRRQARREAMSLYYDQYARKMGRDGISPWVVPAFAAFDAYIARKWKSRHDAILDSPAQLYTQAEIRIAELRSGTELKVSPEGFNNYYVRLRAIHLVLDRYGVEFKTLSEKCRDLGEELISRATVRSWQASSGGNRWIEAHRQGWSHEEFETLMKEIGKTIGAGVDTQHLGEALESMRGSLV